MKSTASQFVRLLVLFCLLGAPSGARAFYDSNLGRWLNRDPITELSDANLHRFVANRPSSIIDSYGLNWVPPEKLLKWDTNGDGVLDNDDTTQRILAQGNPGLQPSLLGELILGGGARACVPRPAFVTVCRWGRPGLRPGEWVMKGGKNWGNYIFSGKYQPASWPGGNIPAAFATGEEFLIYRGSLAYPGGVLGPFKYAIGQRKWCP